jgi:hypothetical protein
MKPTLITLAFLCVIIISAFAQLDHVDITTGTVTARIRAGGPLISEFRVPSGDSTLVAIQDLVLWVGGLDAGHAR